MWQESKETGLYRVSLVCNNCGEDSISTRTNSEAEHSNDLSADVFAESLAVDFKFSLSRLRESAVLGKALSIAGPVQSALDLPCGIGRFWPVFAKAGVSELIAADVSHGMLQFAESRGLREHTPQRLMHTSALQIELPDDAVEFVACMNFYHKLAAPADRRQLLSELRRISAGYVAISVWVDGNLGAGRRMSKPVLEPAPGFARQTCRSRLEVESEFTDAGFTVVRHFDVWPKLSMRRLYLLGCAVV